MPAPYFTTNASEITRLEQLYIVERKPPAAIRGVFLGVVGVVGTTVRGPIDKAIEVTSEARFREVFGGRDRGNGGAISSEVWKALLRKPFGKVVVVRAAATGAGLGTRSLSEATGAWTRAITFDTKANHGNADYFTIDDGVNDPITFELDKAGDGVVSGRTQIDISGATTAADIAALVRTAINAAVTAEDLNLEAVGAPSGGTLTLVASVLGSAGDVDLTISGSPLVLGSETAGVDTDVLRVDAANKGAWSLDLTVQRKAASDGNAAHFNLEIVYQGTSYLLKNIDLSGSNDNLSTVLAGIWPDADTRLVALTKLASGTPDVDAAATALAGGTDGSIADSDFTASSRGLNLLTNYRGIGAVFVAGRSNTAIRSALKTAAAAATDRLFLACANDSTATVSTMQTLMGSGGESLSGTARLVVCFNHPVVIDPETSTEVTTEPQAWMASVLSQIDVDIHPGEEDTKQFTAGISRLTYQSLAREDLISLRDAGVAALEADEGFAFVSGIMANGGEIVDRRATDYLQLSIASELKHFVKKKNNDATRKAMVGMIVAFLNQLKREQRIVEDFEVDGEVLNTSTTRGQGIEKILVRVRLIGHALFLVLETEIGTTVTVRQAA